jgi:CelD/BcsL family acetyltransferase involved in cellulose biosynthesis
MNAPLGRISAEIADRADPRHAFLRPAWFADAERTLEARRGRTTIAALPIVRRRGVAAVAGSYWPCRSFPVAVDADEEELCDFLRRRDVRRALGPAWRMGPVREDDPTALRVRRIASASGWTVLTRPLGTAFVLDLAQLREDGGWPRGSTLRKNRWFEKQLAADGPLEFSFLAGADWTAGLYDALAGIERNSWIASRTDARDAKFLAPRHRRFWESAAADPVLAQMMQAAVMRIGGRPAAFMFSIRSGPILYVIANSYDERFARHSPGRVLAYRELERAMAAGVDEVDWGAGDPGYKSTMGARPGPAIVDLLMVRPRPIAALLRPLWERGGGA